jgi:hypothetical protein
VASTLRAGDPYSYRNCFPLYEYQRRCVQSLRYHINPTSKSAADRFKKPKYPWKISFHALAMGSLQHGRVLHLSTFTIPATTVPTTTYEYTYTYGKALETPPPFITPSVSPSYAPFTARKECCNRWSYLPENFKPTSNNASCAISNAACDNPHSFWDLYACCNGAEIKEFGVSGLGNFNGCHATCDAVGQTFQELMTCLQKRGKIVACKPDDSEIVVASSSLSSTTSNDLYESYGFHPKGYSSTTSTGIADECVETVSNGVSLHCLPTSIPYTSSASSYPGSAGRVDVAYVPGSKTAFAIYTIVALSSAIGMLAI